MAYSLVESVFFSPAIGEIINTDAKEALVTATPIQSELDASLLTYTYAEQLKPVPAFNSAQHWAQRSSTDHSEFSPNPYHIGTPDL